MAKNCSLLVAHDKTQNHNMGKLNQERFQRADMMLYVLPGWGNIYSSIGSMHLCKQHMGERRDNLQEKWENYRPPKPNNRPMKSKPFQELYP